MEYREYNIDVQTLTPNYISTKMTSFSDLLQSPSVAFPTAQSFTSNAIATMGRSGAHPTAGYWFHDLQHYFTKLLTPNWAYRMVSWYYLKHIDSTAGKQK